MTREEQARRREDIKEQFANGISPDDLVKMYGLTKAYIHQIVGFKRETKIDVLRNDVDTIIQKLKGGETKASIAKSYGVDRSSIITVLKESGITCFAVQRNSEEDAARRIFDKTGGRFEYVSGYTNKECTVLIRCTVCGGEFERTYHNLTTAPNPYGCPLCRKAQVEKRNNEASAERFRRQLRVKANKANNSKQFQVVFCEECGNIFQTVDSRRKYCSEQCRAKSSPDYTASSDDRLNKSNVIDKGITLKKLFDKYEGVCQICGEPCDYNDYCVRGNGVFVAGDKYPSKDHIVPLSMGGKHSWKNLRLAHRNCNTKLYWEKQRLTPSRSVIVNQNQ